ncbi:MAG: hybrid sensor histidine kinase/response regulator [Pseudomonadota bacterium]
MYIVETMKKYKPGVLYSSDFDLDSFVYEFDILKSAYYKMNNTIIQHQSISKRSAHLAAIGQMSSHVAHDMRSPLSVIQGYIGGEHSDEMRKAAINGVNKLNRMADELLDYAKASKVEPVITSVKSLVETTVSNEIQKLANERGVKLIYDVSNDIVAKIDHYRMGRVLINLITNAIQAIDGVSGEVRITVKLEEDSLKITVADNGNGIEKESLEKIFDSFFTKGKVKGTGLGLSYCKNVIEAHGGTIEVSSGLGQGTEFVIHIPSCITELHATCHIPHTSLVSPPHTTYHMPHPPLLSPPHATCYMPHAPLVSQHHPEITTSSLQTETPRNDKPATDILVVDDDVGIMLLWNTKIQKKYGKPPLTAVSPEELMKSKFDYNNISKAIVDYQFEGSKLSGLDVVRFLKEKGVKVIHMCTGMFHDEELQREAKELGVVSIIPKPIAVDVDV